MFVTFLWPSPWINNIKSPPRFGCSLRLVFSWLTCIPTYLCAFAAVLHLKWHKTVINLQVLSGLNSRTGTQHTKIGRKTTPTISECGVSSKRTQSTNKPFRWLRLSLSQIFIRSSRIHLLYTCHAKVYLCTPRRTLCPSANHPLDRNIWTPETTSSISISLWWLQLILTREPFVVRGTRIFMSSRTYCTSKTSEAHTSFIIQPNRAADLRRTRRTLAILGILKPDGEHSSQWGFVLFVSPKRHLCVSPKSAGREMRIPELLGKLGQSKWCRQSNDLVTNGLNQGGVPYLHNKKQNYNKLTLIFYLQN